LVARGRAANDRWQQKASDKSVIFFAAATARPTKPKKPTRHQTYVQPITIMAGSQDGWMCGG
jgi:hypothetical protein